MLNIKKGKQIFIQREREKCNIIIQQVKQILRTKESNISNQKKRRKRRKRRKRKRRGKEKEKEKEELKKLIDDNVQ